MRHLDLVLPSLRRLIHTFLNDIASGTSRLEGEHIEMYSKPHDGIWQLNSEQPEDADALLIWHMLKALSEWIPKDHFTCGWLHEMETHEMLVDEIDGESWERIPDYSVKSPRNYFPDMSELVNAAWSEVFGAHIISMKSPKYTLNGHLRILLRNDQDIPNNNIIEIMPSDMSERDIAYIELEYLRNEFINGDEFIPLRFTTSQLAWIISDWIDAQGKEVIRHFAYIPEPKRLGNTEEKEEIPSDTNHALLRHYVVTYHGVAFSKYLAVKFGEPRPEIPEKFPLGSSMNPLFHIRTFDDSREPIGIFLGMIMRYTIDFADSALVEASEFIEYDEETREYLNALAKPEQSPFAGYASLLIGQDKVFMIERLTETFAAIEKEGWNVLLERYEEFKPDIDLKKYGHKVFEVPDKYRKK